jgi:RNA polymerase sigma-70 factor (ECF subfamily)
MQQDDSPCDTYSYVAGFNQVYTRFYPLLYAAALRITKSNCEAHDVAQSVFFKLWSLKKPLESGSLAGWLTIVTRNTAIDIVRRRKRETLYVSRNAGRAPDVNSAEHEALANIECTAVGSAISELRPEIRDLLCESFYEDTPHGAIASRRAIPLGTVKTRIRAGITQLRRLMEAS